MVGKRIKTSCLGLSKRTSLSFVVVLPMLRNLWGALCALSPFLSFPFSLFGDLLFLFLALITRIYLFRFGHCSFIPAGWWWPASSVQKNEIFCLCMSIMLHPVVCCVWLPAFLQLIRKEQEREALGSPYLLSDQNEDCTFSSHSVFSLLPPPFITQQKEAAAYREKKEKAKEVYILWVKQKPNVKR